MLNIETLRAVRRVVVHAHCADGTASAVILKAALPDVEVVAVAYNSAEHRNLKPEPGTLFCDIVPWLPEYGDFGERRAVIKEWTDVGTIVIDHHRGAEPIVCVFGDRGVYAHEKYDPGVSGATLAYLHVFQVMRKGWYHGNSDNIALKQLADIIGIRDTWQKSSPDWQRACEVSAAVRFLPLDEALRLGPAGVMRFADECGALLYRKQLAAARQAAANAIVETIGGLRVAIVQPYAATEDATDMIDAAVVAGFDYRHDAEGPFVKWSLRSRAGIDVSAIARRWGGNGHGASAGFEVRSSELVKMTPYEQAHVVLRMPL